MSDLNASITPVTSLTATIDTIIYPTNYNDLTHKPQINGVTLSGNKTASDLGLASAGDITVTSVNDQTGAVVLDGDDIEYSEGVSVNSKIDDVESMITSSGVTSVNGLTGVVTLTGTNIEYSGGVSVNSKIDAVESSIPVVNYPVTSVNAQTGAVVLDGEDIEYSSGVSVNSKIDAVESSIPVVSYPVTSVNAQTGAVVLDGEDIEYSSGVSVNSKIDTNSTNIGDLTQLSTSVTSSLVGAVNEVNTGLGNTYTKSEVDTKLAKKAPIVGFNTYELSSAKPIVISNIGIYHCLLIVGFAQGIGDITVVVKISNGTISAFDFISGASFSNANITFSYSSDEHKLTITSTKTSNSQLAIMRMGV